MKKYISKQHTISVIGTWSGREDEVTTKIGQLGFMWRIQTGTSIEEFALEDDQVKESKPLLATTGPRKWQNATFGVDSMIAYDDSRGDLMGIAEEYLDANYDEVTE